MRSLSPQELRQIPTAPLNDRRNYFAYLQSGFKICRCCQKFIKWEAGKLCPFCHRTLRTKPRSSKARQRFQKVGRKDLEFSYLQQRQCSLCGSTSPKHFHTHPNGKKYPHWNKDGKGGYLCNPCYNAVRKKARMLIIR